MVGIMACSQLIFSQSYHVHNYSEDDGLLNSTVHDLLQDSAGRMWFSTRSGISCYDGAYWTSYTAANGLSGVDFKFLDIDNDGVVWAISIHRKFSIAYFQNEKWHSFDVPPLENYPTFLTGFRVSSVNGKKIVAIASRSSGLYLLSGNQWKIYPDNFNGTIHNFDVLKDTFYVAAESGLFCVTENSLDSHFNDVHPLPSQNIRGIRIEKIGNARRIWLAGSTWIGYIENDQFTLIADKLNIPFDRKYHCLLLQPDHRGGLFYGNPMGLFYLNPLVDNPERLGLESGMISEGVTSLFLDREKNIWCATLRGVSKIAGMCFQNYRKINGLLNDEVSAIAEIKPGSFLFGHNYGLTFYENEKFKHHKFYQGKYASSIANRVLDITVDQQNNIWMAVSDYGLIRYDQEGKIHRFDEKSQVYDFVKSVLVDRKNRLWISDAKGLAIKDGNKFQRIGMDDDVFRSIRKIFQGPGEKIYLATFYYGLYMYEQGRWTKYHSPGVESANRIYAVLSDSKDRLLVGSLAGLFTVDHDTLKRFDLNGYRLRRSVYLIIEDRKKRLWFGTDNGVIRWDGNEIREYNVHNGFVGREINRSAGVVDHQGRVWIGTDLGVSCYREEYDCDQEAIPPPIVKLTDIEVQGERRSYYSVSRLGYRENNLVFHFKCISFIDENAISYRVKLDGSDKGWVEGLDAGSQKMRYTHLAPGTYRFHVQAQNALGKWSPVVSSQDVIISRPIWRQWWLHLGVVFFLALIGAGIYRFITETKYARNLEIKVRERTNQLQESERRYRQMFESNQAVMLLIDPCSGYVVDANPAACQFFGHNHANMLKLHFPMYQNICNSADNPAHESFPIPEYVITHQRLASSRIRDVEIYACSIYLQGQKFIYLIIHDISERLQAEKALAAEKERLAVTLHSIGDGVISTDTEGKINLMNEVAENMTGWLLQDAYGKNSRAIFNIIREKSRTPCQNPVENVLKRGQMQKFSSYNILMSRTGEERIIAASASPIHDHNQKLIGVVLVFRDMTKQRKLEEELFKAGKIESIGVLAGGIAHDFNNILTGIIGNLSLGMMNLNKNEALYKLLAGAEKASYRAKDLTHQLLTFSKGGLPIKKATALATLIEETVEFILRGSKVHYEMRMPKKLWPVMVDPGQINQVIHNLVLNAEQAMPNGGVIKITLENLCVNHSNLLPVKRGRYVKLTINDTGIGISDDNLQKIFDPYFTTKQKGSGLGLATSYSIIKKHEGHISVESRLGEGTMFAIYLPATSEKQTSEINDEIDETVYMRKVLLMDDDETIRSTTGKMLEYLGYEVETASNGEEAIEKYVNARESNAPFDVAIFDLTVRGAMGGKEALQKLMKIDPMIKVIVSSGYSNDPIMANYEKYGFRGVVTKPYEITMLSTSLKAVLRNDRA